MLGFFYNFWRKGFGGQVLEIHVAARSYRKTFPKLNIIPSLSFVYDQLIAITRGSASAQVNIFIQSDTELKILSDQGAITFLLVKQRNFDSLGFQKGVERNVFLRTAHLLL